MQGFNMGRYVPPDQEGRVSGNQLLGVRANKATAAGVPVVRFEMPFAVWCDGCAARTAAHHPVLVPQGVRFNAEKHRAGAYYSTPIWLFRMRHPPCGTWLEIRTDPKTTSYVVAAGGRKRREYDDDDDTENDSPDARAAASAAALTGLAVADVPSDAARASAFDRLERTIAHREADAAASDAASVAARRLHALSSDSARHWEDPYARNRALRAHFRAGRHAREQAAAADDELRTRLGGLDAEALPLLPATEEDARRAALVDFGGPGRGGLGSATVGTDGALAKPLFGQRERKTSSKTAHAVRDHLAATVAANTRLATDPFLKHSWDGKTAAAPSTPRLAGVKRKRAPEDSPGPPTPEPKPDKVDKVDKVEDKVEDKVNKADKVDKVVDKVENENEHPGKTALVSYDSD